MSNFTYLSKDTPKHYICSKCGAKNVKLWTPNTEPVKLMCAKCACESQDGFYMARFEIGNMVPAVPDEELNGMYWPFTADIPNIPFEWWLALPTHESE